jgi:DNA-binding transcriptional LysR family regulator
MFDWTLVRAFVAVAETGSAAGAARALGRSQPTVSRHVAELERQLGLALFVRRADGLVPTDKALELLEQARAMREAADGISRRAEGLHDDLAGTVRVSASEVIASEYLPGAFATLADVHPQLAVELVSTNSAVDLTRREADVAVRMFRPRQPDLIARRVTDFPIGVFAARAYLERHGTPASVAELAGHRLLGMDTEFDAEAISRMAGRPMTRDDFAFRTDSRLAQIAALRAGLGIGFMQRRLAARHGDLVELPLPLPLPSLPLYVVTHGEMRTSRRMKALFDHLVAHFEALPAFD